MTAPRLLQVNPEPIKIVSQAQRDVWTKLPGWRCDYEDGRGRCTSRVTFGVWLSAERRTAFYCARHAEKVSRVGGGS